MTLQRNDDDDDDYGDGDGAADGDNGSQNESFPFAQHNLHLPASQPAPLSPIFDPLF